MAAAETAAGTGGFPPAERDPEDVDVADDDNSSTVSDNDDDQESEGMDITTHDVDDRFLRAAVFVEDALHNRSTDHLVTRSALRVYQFYHTSLARAVMTVTIFVQFSLAFFERPATPPFHNVSVEYEGLWNALEFLCLLLYAMEAGARLYYQGRRTFWRDPWNLTKVAVVTLMFIDALFRVALITPVRFTRILRPFFLLEKKRVRMIVQSILKTVPRIMDVVFLAMFFVFIFGVIGYLLFLDTPQHEIFRTLGMTYEHLIVLITTANYPDVMMPAYRYSRWYSLYFIGFLIVTLYLIMNLMMAVIYTHYRNSQQEEVSEALMLETSGLKAAFRELDADGKGEIGFDGWVKLFRALRPKYPLEKVAIMFYLVDYDDNKTLDADEFYRVARILKLRIRRTPHQVAKPTGLGKLDSRMRVVWWLISGTRETLRMWVQFRAFDLVVDSLIVLSGILSFIETEQTQQSSRNDDWMDPTQYVFCLVFVTEQLVRIFAAGFKQYWRSSWSRFDLTIVSASFVAENISMELSPSVRMSGLLRIMLLIRVFRLFRLINGIKRFKIIVGTVFQLVPALGVFFKLLIALYYFYAIIGMEFFAHKIYRGHPAVVGTPFDQDDYYANTFDNFPYAMVTLFELMVVNNWMVTMDGYAAVCGDVSRVYFVSWWLISVVLILNIIVAFVLEAYSLQWEINLTRKDRERQLRLELGRAEARANRENTSVVPIDMAALEVAVSDDSLGASGVRWMAEQRQHIADLLRIMHESDLQEELVATANTPAEPEGERVARLRAESAAVLHGEDKRHPRPRRETVPEAAAAGDEADDGHTETAAARLGATVRDVRDASGADLI